MMNQGGGEGEKKAEYGTFQGQHQQYERPSSGFPQPVPPPGVSASAPPYHPQGYQTAQGYAVVEGTPVRQPRLPCCGIGIGWLMFLLGFVFGTIPWYAGAVIIIFAQVDSREKPGYIACTIGAALATIAIIFGATQV